MATRFYFPRIGGTPSAPPAPISPTQASAWNTVPAITRALLSPSKTGTQTSSETTATYSETVTTVGNLLHKQFVSDPLSAQTISGTFTIVIRGGESAMSADASFQIVIRVLSNNGSTVRGTLFAGHTAALNTTPGALGCELPTSTSAFSLRNIALTSVAAQAGDRLVVELGHRYHNTSATSYGAFFTFHDDLITADFTVDGEKNSLVPWIEFSGNIAPFAPLTQVTDTVTTTWETTAPVLAEQASTWSDLTPVEASLATSWAAASIVAASRTTTWVCSRSLSGSRATLWGVGGSVTLSRGTSWATLRTTSTSAISTWTVCRPVASSHSTLWTTNRAATGTCATIWATAAPVSATHQTAWECLAHTPPAARASGWHRAALTEHRHATAWDALTQTGTSRATSWVVRLPAVTYRPSTGHTPRPTAGSTGRPHAGTTARPTP